MKNPINRAYWHFAALLLAAGAGCVTFPHSAGAQDLSPNVRIAIADWCGKKAADLTTNDLAKITELEFDNNSVRARVFPVKIADLEGKSSPFPKDMRITDDDLANLDKLPALNEIKLSDTEVSDAGLEHLAKLPAIRCLYLSETHVTDAGLKHLANLSTLSVLDLSHTQVTDEGLQYLKNLPKLHMLTLWFSRVTRDGVKQLRKEMPNCRINE